MRWISEDSSPTSSWLRPPAGSSRSSRRGFETSARAIATRFSVLNGSPAAIVPAYGDRLEVLERLCRAPVRAALGEGPRPRVNADQDVLQHGHVLEEDDVLERPGDPEARDTMGPHAQQIAAVEEDSTPLSAVEARHDVEQCRLAGTVRTDQTADLAFAELERDLFERNDSAEPPCDVLDRKKRHWRRDDMTVQTASAFRR